MDGVSGSLLGHPPPVGRPSLIVLLSPGPAMNPSSESSRAWQAGSASPRAGCAHVFRVAAPGASGGCAGWFLSASPDSRQPRLLC